MEVDGNAEAVRRANDFDPLPNFQFIGTQRSAHIVVENFRGRSRNTAQSGFLQHQQILAQGQARFLDAVRDFHGRIGVHMKFRQASLDGAKKFNVVVAVEIFREAALNAHFGGAALDRLERLGNQRIRGMKISIRRIRPAAEPAKSAADDADVGEIQISVHHVRDAVADRAPAKLVRDLHQRQQVVPFDRGQRQSLFETEIVPGKDFLQGLGDVSARRRKRSIQGNFAPFGIHCFQHVLHSPRA